MYLKRIKKGELPFIFNFFTIIYFTHLTSLCFSHLSRSCTAYTSRGVYISRVNCLGKLICKRNRSRTTETFSSAIIKAFFHSLMAHFPFFFAAFFTFIMLLFHYIYSHSLCTRFTISINPASIFIRLLCAF